MASVPLGALTASDQKHTWVPVQHLVFAEMSRPYPDPNVSPVSV